MKSVLVVVSIIAVFSAASREFPDKSDLGPAYLDEPFPEESVGTNIAEEPKNTHDRTDIRGLADEVQNFPGEPVEHESADGIQVSNDGPQGLYQQFIEESEGINTAQLRGKQQNKILKQIVKDLEYIKEEFQSVKEIKIDLQSIKDHQNNLTYACKELKEELKKEVAVIKQNTDNKTSLVISKLDSINTGNSELKEELSSFNQNMDNETSLIISKLDSIHERLVIEPLTSLDPIHPPTTTPAGCPLGFILIDDQCYKYITDQRINWMDADEMCRSQGLTLAQPRDPLGIRKYLVENYADYTWTWLGGRGTGSVIQWQRGGQVLSSTSAYWFPGHPGGRTSSDYCLMLLTSSGTLNSQPNKPYYTSACTYSRYPLCEKM